VPGASLRRKLVEFRSGVSQTELSSMSDGPRDIKPTQPPASRSLGERVSGFPEGAEVVESVEHRTPSDVPVALLDASPQSERRERFRDAVTQLVELHHVAMDISLADGELSMIRVAVLGARERLGVDRLAVFLRDGDSVQGTWGTDETGAVVDERDFRRPIRELPDHEMVERAFREQNYVAIRRDVQLHTDTRIVGTGWNAMVALWYADEALGWVACDNLLTGGALDKFQVEVLKLFAASLAQALVRGRAETRLRDLNRELEGRVAVRTAEVNAANEALELANGELRKLSRSDGLTGIANRRLFDERLREEWTRCGHNEQNVAVVLIDVDFFKQFNDSEGHVAGDDALRKVALALDACVLRGSDLAARYGGEEFVLLLPLADEERALAVAERAKACVEALEISHPASKAASRLTVSLGVAVSRPGPGALEDLIRSADEALYQAKQSGRNRVVVAPGGESF